MPSLAATDRGKYRVGARPVTGHESHCPCRPSSPQRELPVVFKRLFVARFLAEGLGAGLVWLRAAGSYKMRDLFSCPKGEKSIRVGGSFIALHLSSGNGRFVGVFSESFFRLFNFL